MGHFQDLYQKPHVYEYIGSMTKDQLLEDVSSKLSAGSNFVYQPVGSLTYIATDAAITISGSTEVE